MADRQPTDVTNLDRYGNEAMPWGRARDVLAANLPEKDTPYFLGTTRPDGRPHVVGIGACWLDGDFYFTSSLASRKSRNLASNPACTLAARLTGIDLTVEGVATLVTDAPTLERVVAVYRAGGWPAQVEGEAFVAPFSAPSAGPPPWHLYRLVFHTAIGIATAEPYGATRWRFDD